MDTYVLVKMRAAEQVETYGPWSTQEAAWEWAVEFLEPSDFEDHQILDVVRLIAPSEPTQMRHHI